VEIVTAAAVAALDVLVAAAVDVDDLLDVELELPQPDTSRVATDASRITTGFPTGTSLPFSGAPDGTPTRMKDG
jgi:hypothetical protein